MKRTIIQLASVLLLLSCSNNDRQSSSIKDADKSSNNVVNTESKYVEEVSDKSLSLPSGYSKGNYTEYVPQNDIERSLLADIKEMENATNKLDYKKIISLYYPDFFEYIHKLVPEKTIPEIKDWYEGVLSQELAERNKQYTNEWPEAIRAGMVVTNIMNRVKEGNGLLYLYEYHNVLYSETDTIVKDEAEYSVAASLNNGKKWYNSANSIEENFKILGISFSKKAIEDVLTQ